MCEICRQVPCDCRCPNYSSTALHYRCSLCGDSIEIGEEYIESYNGDMAHVECCSLYGITDTLNFLDIDVKTMEDL